MKLKLASLGLLALAPMAAQAELVEMQDTDLSDVQGQAFTIPGILVSRTFDVDVDTDLTPPTYDAVYTDVPGGVERVSTFKTKYTITPSFSYKSTGNFTGNSYRMVERGTPVDLWDIAYTRTRTDLGFNPDR
ncbi:MAG: hypothetical protein AMXMBFR76_20170 [Pseudomonadota bacterium]|jgi:hypothetical protein